MPTISLLLNLTREDHERLAVSAGLDPERDNLSTDEAKRAMRHRARVYFYYGLALYPHD
jgi:hypothetical protein